MLRLAAFVFGISIPFWLGTTSSATSRCPPSMVVIDAGEFVMGSDTAERQLAYARSSPAVRDAAWFDAELPRRAVPLPEYCIDRSH